jgi:hypothetical protein
MPPIPCISVAVDSMGFCLHTAFDVLISERIRDGVIGSGGKVVGLVQVLGNTILSYSHVLNPNDSTLTLDLPSLKPFFK